MLVYKAWRESRARFLLSTATLGWFCALFIIVRPMMHEAATKPFVPFVEDSIYTGSIRNFFCVFVLVLGLGGLLQETSRGSAAFTLSLPVTRARLIAVRAAVGVAEVVALALVPTVAVLGLAPFQGEAYGVFDAMQCSTQWAVTGTVIFAVAFLFSTWLSGTYAALTASIIVVGAYALLVTLSPMRHVPVLNVLTMMDHAHPGVVRLAGTSLVSVAIITAGMWLTERKDF
jgi:ABC-type transport system involved in multi-copper enzyme maturation permease subunit